MRRWINKKPILKLSHKLLFISLLIPFILVASLLYYSAQQLVHIKNKPKEQLALSTAESVIDKIDRTFYERFADVQAFASSETATNSLTKDSSIEDMIKFMNNMMAYYVMYDAMMVCSIDGKVIAFNTKDKTGKKVNAVLLKGKNVNDQEWFRNCIATGGPASGAFYSDFNIDEDLKNIYGGKGYGIDFAAPIKNKEGKTIGVWRNRASWKAITQQITNEANEALGKEEADGLILILNRQGHVIDAQEENNILKINLGKNNLFKKFDFKYSNREINEANYMYGWADSKGAYTYKGNQWKALSLIPRIKLNRTTFLNADWLSLALYSLLLFLLAVVISVIFIRKISKRIEKVKESILKISKGEPATIQNISSKDEIAEMSLAVNYLSNSFKTTALFAEQIGKGNLDVLYKASSENDVLGQSLITMKNNLQFIQQEEGKRSWASEGLAQLNEILRKSLQKKYGLIISFLVKYLKAHQGGIFIIDENKDPYEIVLEGFYAYTQEKYSEKILLKGEGALGQCILDKNKIILTNIPEGFSEISSGLGNASPKFIAIIPAKLNDLVVGAIEIASFRILEEYEIAFIEKASEHIASYVQQFKANQKTERMLQHSQELTANLRNQEEELRQNMEELNSTQEEMKKREFILNEEMKAMKDHYETQIRNLI